MIYVFDLDHTLCDVKRGENGRWKYFEALPYFDRIEKVNKLWKDGHTIIIESARGCDSKVNYYEVSHFENWCKVCSTLLY